MKHLHGWIVYNKIDNMHLEKDEFLFHADFEQQVYNVIQQSSYKDDIPAEEIQSVSQDITTHGVCYATQHSGMSKYKPKEDGFIVYFWVSERKSAYLYIYIIISGPCFEEF